ncbi:hypothetical protein KGF56_001868 [Candida oxycetoniae]|uniref:Orc1-like AAA ATPase domain-containing protein n=1 Tax=Candida oxycetoniae TaxID=497107 RepID=A0AAI9SYV9_9ASCO|nr:uncharacterized protein KGF56_001868 [Candida oxycetoniae]KAI3405327.2 hypothetical protein KGF56_001868 [Candida oxycetoniae]
MSLTQEQLVQLKSSVIERDSQFDALNAYINKDAALSSSCILVNSFKPVGKTLVVKAFLKMMGLRHSIIQCDECVSKQMLLQRCYNSLLHDSGIPTTNKNHYVPSTSENFASLLSALEDFIVKNDYREHHVLVLDRFDQVFENCESMISALSRFKECSKVQNLTVVVIFNGAVPRDVVTYTNPNVYFPVYNETQLVRILQQEKLCKFTFHVDESEARKEEFYKQYAKVVVDSFFDYTGSDVTLLKSLVVKLWDGFVDPIRLGNYKMTDFVKLYKENIEMFSARDDLVCSSNVIEYRTLQNEDNVGFANVQDLPLHSKFILLASYLASHGNQRNDLHKYAKVKVFKYKKRASNKAGKQGHLSKSDIDNRLLTANYVDLERILAILSVIYQHSAPSLNQSDKNDLLYLDDKVVENELKKDQEKSKFTLTRNIDLNNQIATLFSLGFLGKTATSDILAARIRWKCNLDWPTVEAIAKSVNFPITDFLADA